MKKEALDYRTENNCREKLGSGKQKLQNISDVAPCQSEGLKPQEPSVELCCVF